VLQNAASIAGLMLTTDRMVADLPEDKASPPMGDMSGMGGTMQNPAVDACSCIKLPKSRRFGGAFFMLAALRLRLNRATCWYFLQLA
jgi:hypothetical protein